MFSGARSVLLWLFYKYLMLIRSRDLLQYSFSSFKEGNLNETISEGKQHKLLKQLILLLKIYFCDYPYAITVKCAVKAVEEGKFRNSEIKFLSASRHQ